MSISRSEAIHFLSLLPLCTYGFFYGAPKAGTPPSTHSFGNVSSTSPLPTASNTSITLPLIVALEKPEPTLSSWLSEYLPDITISDLIIGLLLVFLLLVFLLLVLAAACFNTLQLQKKVRAAKAQMQHDLNLLQHQLSIKKSRGPLQDKGTQMVENLSAREQQHSTAPQTPRLRELGAQTPTSPDSSTIVAVLEEQISIQLEQIRKLEEEHTKAAIAPFPLPEDLLTITSLELRVSHQQKQINELENDAEKAVNTAHASGEESKEMSALLEKNGSDMLRLKNENVGLEVELKKLRLELAGKNSTISDLRNQMEEVKDDIWKIEKDQEEEKKQWEEQMEKQKVGMSKAHEVERNEAEKAHQEEKEKMKIEHERELLGARHTRAQKKNVREERRKTLLEENEVTFEEHVATAVLAKARAQTEQLSSSQPSEIQVRGDQDELSGQSGPSATLHPAETADKGKGLALPPTSPLVDPTQQAALEHEGSEAEDGDDDEGWDGDDGADTIGSPTQADGQEGRKRRRTRGKKRPAAEMKERRALWAAGINPNAQSTSGAPSIPGAESPAQSPAEAPGDNANEEDEGIGDDADVDAAWPQSPSPGVDQGERKRKTRRGKSKKERRERDARLEAEAAQGH